MSYVEFQCMSNLHLETQIIRPNYDSLKIKPESKYLALLLGPVSCDAQPKHAKMPFFSFSFTTLYASQRVFQSFINKTIFKMI